MTARNDDAKRKVKHIHIGGNINVKSDLCTNSVPAALNNEASSSMFREKDEAICESHKRATCDSLQLAAEYLNMECTGKGTLATGNLKLCNSLYVHQFSEILVSIGYIRGQD